MPDHTSHCAASLLAVWHGKKRPHQAYSRSIPGKRSGGVQSCAVTHLTHQTLSYKPSLCICERSMWSVSACVRFSLSLDAPSLPPSPACRRDPRRQSCCNLWQSSHTKVTPLGLYLDSTSVSLSPQPLSLDLRHDWYWLDHAPFHHAALTFPRARSRHNIERHAGQILAPQTLSTVEENV